MSITLRGMDGTDPLGFLAALGVLRVLEDRAPAVEPRLSWVDEGTWVPRVEGVPDIATLVDVLMADLATWKAEPALLVAYTKDGESVAPDVSGAVRDLKAPPVIQRELFASAAAWASEGRPRSARTLAAFGTDVALDNNGMSKPTALHFTAGQQQFLKMAGELRAGLSSEDFEEALNGPWGGDSRLPSFSWSGTGQRMYALRASDPSKDKRGSTPGAEWLGLMGLSFFPCAPTASPRGPRTATTGVTGGWKTGQFSWPLWCPPIDARTVRSLLGHPGVLEPSSLDGAARAVMGIEAIVRTRILRSDQGGYGSFTPAELV